MSEVITSLPPLLMVDLASTVASLCKCYIETDKVAWFFMLGLGLIGGAIAYHSMWRCVRFAVVGLWPGQWAAPVLGCLSVSQAVIANLILLSKGKPDDRA